MKFLDNATWTLFTDNTTRLEARIRDLEAQNSALLDRLLIEKGQVPIDMGLQRAIVEDRKTQEELFEQLTVEEIGEYPADDDTAVRPQE